MNKNKLLRVTMGGILLAMGLVAGISVYHTTQTTEETTGELTAQTDGIDRKILSMPEETEDVLSEEEVDQQEPTEEDLAETATENVQVQTEDALTDTEAETREGESEKTQETATEAETQEEATEKTQETAATVSTGFTENSQLSWPVEGTILLDYSMDKTIYFSTLNEYKCNPAILLKAKTGTTVEAGFAGTVKDVYTSEETGNTVAIDMGNGYEAVYGQLQNISVKQGDTIEKGEQLAEVGEPTKYYKNEGTHLYFAMTKDDQPVDPALYTETGEE